MMGAPETHHSPIFPEHAKKRLQPVQAWQRRAKYLRFLKQISSISEDSEGSQIRGN
ncbi:hypothetical protein FORC36_4275 [Vibrio vulnificus]|nr:hypothetical protein FORC36_4275 [Vibrio vulnificus]